MTTRLRSLCPSNFHCFPRGAKSEARVDSALSFCAAAPSLNRHRCQRNLPGWTGPESSYRWTSLGSPVLTYFEKVGLDRNQRRNINDWAAPKKNVYCMGKILTYRLQRVVESLQVACNKGRNFILFFDYFSGGGCCKSEDKNEKRKM